MVIYNISSEELFIVLFPDKCSSRRPACFHINLKAHERTKVRRKPSLKGDVRQRGSECTVCLPPLWVLCTVSSSSNSGVFEYNK